jgi:hypothetical protein
MWRLALLVGLCGAASAQPWWEREPLRIIDLVTSLGRIDYLPPETLAERKAAQLYNAEHLDIMTLPAGLDDRGFFFRSKYSRRENPDFLGQYLPEARKRGIRVLIYFNVHWYTQKFGEDYPDWRQIREDGQPLSGVYDTGTDFCVNTPWREWVFGVLRDLCAYPIDGIFYDGPVYRPDTCYCRYCREKFRKIHGTELPSKKERKGRAFQQLVEFQAGSIADFLRDSRRIMKELRPEAALYMNGGLRAANWATGRLNRLLIAEQDLLGAEGGFIYGDLTRMPLWKPGLTARLLETQAEGKPRVIFSAAAHKPWTFSLLPAPELRLLYADSIANAANVWMGITPFEFEQPEMAVLTEMNRFVRDNGEYLHNTRSEARVALVWSDVTANFYAGSEAQLIDIDHAPSRSEIGNLEAEFSGLADALVRSQVPFDVVDDVTLEREPLERYRLIVLPNVACMSEAVARRLRDYVEKGGNLLATFESSLYDETGVRRKDFALADVFGVAGAGKIAGPRRWDFMKPEGSDRLLEGLARELMPSPTYYVPLQTAGARDLLRFTRPLAGRYDGVPEPSNDPALAVREFGGGRVVYFAGDLGAAIHNFHVAEHAQLVENTARALAPPAVVLGNAPSSVEVVLRSQEGGKRWLLHLVNFTGEMTRPIRKIVPLRDVRVTVAAEAGVKSARTLVGRRKLAVRRDSAERAAFVIPSMDEYEVVVMER